VGLSIEGVRESVCAGVDMLVSEWSSLSPRLFLHVWRGIVGGRRGDVDFISILIYYPGLVWS